LIFGIGNDIIEVKRVGLQLEKNNGFKEKIFTENEIEYCYSKKNFAENFAGRWAAKESFFKAIGTGWRGGLAFSEIEIVNDELGKPDIILHGKARDYIKNAGVKNIFITISHIKEMASAVVILER